MKILYLSTWDFTNEEADGVCKKMKAQLSVFEKNGYDVDFIYIKNDKLMYRENGEIRILGTLGKIKKTPAYMKMYKYLKKKRYDLVYNRYGMMDTFYYRVLKKLNQNGAKIIIEIPTYPYVGENPGGLLYDLMFKWDEFYLNKLKNIVERIVTYSRDEQIWGISTLKIINGIDLDSISVVDTKNKTEEINLLAVALLQPSHGYERLLYGMKQYYEDGGKREIYFHIVGDGPEKEKYVQLVKEYGLEKRVLFYGYKSGKELEDIYSKIDIGICSFGAYKKGIYLSSELKSREYIAKGLPIVSGVVIDIFENIKTKYYLEFPNDSSAVDMRKIVDFYDNIYRDEDNAKVVKDIKTLAEKYMGMQTTMGTVFDYIDKK